jgi:C_GCAxxG_C_C family probable redox protein
MQSKILKASSLHKSGYNCAQSVVAAFEEELNIDKNLALHVSVGFGGGMGRMQEKCGAVTGAFMVLGVYNGRKFQDNVTLKNETYAMIQQFDRKFTSIHQSTNCMDLLKWDIKTAEGFQSAKDNGLFESVCDKCIADAIQIVEELINK